MHSCTVLLLLAAVAISVRAQSFPAGFAQVNMKAGFNNNNANIAIKMAFLPDGRIMYAVRYGDFFISPNVQPLTPSLLFTIKTNVNANGELGYVR